MIKILKSGLLTTVQDLGRYGYQKYGIIASGAMDTFAHRLANNLVGNKESSAAMEITMLGPVMEFHKDTLISICGGNLSPHINGQEVGMWRPILVKKGSELRFGTIKSGCRSYLAVAGGIQVAEVMESRSTYLRAKTGGFHGRALDKDDIVPVGNPNPLAKQMIQQLSARSTAGYKEMPWSVAASSTSYFPKNEIRVMEGQEFNWFIEESREKLFTNTFKVSPQSDRMGYRLKGPELALTDSRELLSAAVSFGTIQVPADGNPIILLADRQTTGGYPRIGQVATVDLPGLAQTKPGDHLKFEEISHQEAQKLWFNQERLIQNIKAGIQLKVK